MSNILETQGVVKRYANHTALDGVSIAIPTGSIFGLLGPNGAGKTSLIRIINQITAPDEGQVFLAGEPLHPKHIAMIGYLPEERGLYKKMEVGEQLIYLARLKGMSRAEAIKRLKYWFVKFDIKDWWNKKVEDLSKGMQQKTQFIATIVHDPALIILDEPFSGFDPINANLLKDEILELKEQGKSIIFSTHRMESVEELCDNIALINHAKVVLHGNKKEIKNRFKDNSFTIDLKGDMPSLSADYHVLTVSQLEDGATRIKVRISEEGSVRSLIGQINEQTNLIAFEENIPDFNQIFIQVVK